MDTTDLKEISPFIFEHTKFVLSMSCDLVKGLMKSTNDTFLIVNKLGKWEYVKIRM